MTAPALPLLRTKLQLPALRSGLVERPGLIARLSAGLEGRLTLVSTPAGFGKTTLVAAWVQQMGLPFSWLTLDASDNDAARFLSYLVAALQQVQANIGSGVAPLLQASQSVQPEFVIAQLINDITSFPELLLCVLDDYHAISELAIHNALGLLLDRQPPNLHLVISTRHDPPLPLSRLRGRGQMTEIRQADLRFTRQEARAFLTQAMGLPLTEGEVAELEERTEGWITGLQLAGLSMQGHDREGIARFISGFSGRHHFVLDYLTDEVLHRQPDRLQQFLLKTSILERMCGPLCDALLGAGEPGIPQASQQTLEQFDAANLFVVPLDEERRWYRYQNLFAELLRARLRETDATAEPELHRRAVAWYEANGHGPEAVHHALASGDHDLAADVVQRQIMKLASWTRFDVVMLLGWLQALPTHIVHSRPWLWLFTFRAMFAAGKVEESVRVLDELEETLRAGPTLPDAQRVLQLAAADRASLAATRGDVQQAVAFAHRYLAQLEETDTLGRMRGAAILGMAHFRAGNVALAGPAFAEAVELARTANVPVVAVPFMCNLAEVQIAKGNLRMALATCEAAEQMGSVNGTDVASSGFVGLVRAEILYERNELDEAEARLREGMALLNRGGIAEQFAGNLHVVLAQVRQARGDTPGAQAAMEWVLQVAQGGSIPRLAVQAAAHQARLWLAQGQLDQASAWAKRYQKLDETECLREFEDLTLARVWLAFKQPQKARQLLDVLLGAAESAGRWGRAVEIRALRALALQALEDHEQALAELQAALTVAELEGYVRVFLDAGQPMRTLLKRAASSGIAPAYVARLLGAFAAHAGEAGADPALAFTEQPLVEPLSEREMEVLRLLAQRLSNKEIAQRLYISLPTVKSHTRSIYGKLGVHGRKEAVARAASLGILPPA